MKKLETKITSTALKNTFDFIVNTINIPFVKRYEKVYGEFDKQNYEQYTLRNLPNESQFYHGEIIKWAQDSVNEKSRVLLAGEDRSMKEIFKKVLSTDEIYTSFLENSDYNWDFENNPPKDMGGFDMIISQAMLEHLVDPFKHVKDLSELSNIGGKLIFHTHTQFFPYHRYPVDTLRFFPDWFEEVGKKLGLKINNKRVKSAHIFYEFEKRL